MINVLFLGWLSFYEPKPAPPSYIPKSQRMPKSQWIKAYLKFLRGAPIHWSRHSITTTTGQRSRRSGYPLGYKRKTKRKRKPTPLVEAFPTTYNDKQIKTIHWDSDGQPLMVDNGASASITPHLTDFISPPKPINSKVKGIGGHAQATYKGTVQWKIQDDQGQSHRFTLPNSYYVATAPSHILYPQHLAQTAKDNYPLPLGTGEVTGDEYIQLFWDQRKYVKTIKLDPRRNIGMTHTAPGIHRFTDFLAQQAITTPAGPCCFDTHVIPEDDDEESLQPPDPIQPQTQEIQPQFPLQQMEPLATPQDPSEKTLPTTTQLEFSPIQQTEKPNLIEEEEEPSKLTPSDELLRWHYKLGHAPFTRLQQMATRGDLPIRLATVIPPFCAACKYGKQTKRPWRTKGPQGHIRMTTLPGQVVSVDQLESSTPGFVAQLKGLLTTQRYKYATIFVDQYSKLSFVFLQKRITSAETVLAKQSFERFACDHGVKILHYHADNGRFADNGFIQACKDNNQGLTYCGVNAHFQNGVAEKRIWDLQEQARTMLLFAVHKWPKMLSMALWPYALPTANEVRNATPLDNQTKTPLELFTQVDIAPKLKHFHTFGCPTYILDNKLQGNQTIQKWQARARLGIYLGPSPNHSRSISLILNPHTGHTLPQYHVKHDDFFETVTPKKTTNFDAPPPEWKYLARFLQRKRPSQQKAGDTKHTSQHNTSVQVSEGARHEPTMNPPTEQPLQSELNPHIEEQANPRILAPPQQLPQEEMPPIAPIVPPTLEEETPQVTTTRSGRSIRPTARYQQSLAQREQGIVAWEILVDQDKQENIPTAKQQYDLQAQLAEPIVYAASSDPDILYLHEAMRASDRAQFIKAMEREIKGDEEGNHWVLVPKHQVPKGTKVLDAVWSMRRKRRIESQEIYKWKARLNVHGGQQVHGIDYWDTYTPVVAWPVIQFFFILYINQGWKTRQLDFIMAFPQAPIQTPLYMNIPKGYKMPKDKNNHPMVLKLIRNIYGQKQGPKVWGDFLHQGLTKASFEQSKVDPCLYYREGLIFLVYIDDCLLLSPSDKLIDQGISDLRKAEPCFNMEDQGTVNDFLGIQVKHKQNGEITLTQPQLIASILNDLHLNKNNVHTRKTPSLSTILLHKDANGQPMTNEFNYRSVIGKLNFLEKSTRPDIAYAVHQCARFSVDPKQSHADAVKHIGRYLKGAPNVGITLRPDTQQSFQCWVDADFSGNWKPEGAQHDPMTAKSRSGWIILYAGCPITWLSKLQTLTALSTTEAEYVALSMAMREQLPLIQLLKEVIAHKIDATLQPTTIHCKAFEDNSGALEMAKVPKMRPRTKHLNNVYHHFRESVQNNDVTLIAVRSDEQLADLLTKPLPDALFQRFWDQVLNSTTADQKPLGEGV